jgi:hypothetical protein
MLGEKSERDENGGDAQKKSCPRSVKLLNKPITLLATYEIMRTQAPVG